MSESNPDLWKKHWQDEGDAAYLYRVLAECEPDGKRADLYRRLAGVEDRHVQLWQELLEEQGEPVGAFRGDLITRLL